ncbi:MAG: glycosyltransferase family 4 protein [Thermoplasmata archaeon]|nr:glycosyltransferase family 4 protein [Thermoplasmata archaeon]
MKICFIYHLPSSFLEKDARVLKEIRTLSKAGHDLTVLCRDENLTERRMYAYGTMFRCIGLNRSPRIPSLENARKRLLFNILVGKKALKIINYLGGTLVGKGNYIPIYKDMVRQAIAEDPDVFHVHDYPPLLVGVVAGKLLGRPVIYDAHEYLRGLPSNPARRVKMLRPTAESFLSRRCERVITVNATIAKMMKKENRIKKPVVLKNFPLYQQLQESNILHETLNIPKEKRIAIYQGRLQHGRGIERLIEAAKKIPEIEFVFMGDGPLKKEIKRRTKTQRIANIHIIDAVPQEDLLIYTSSAHIGIHPMENTCLNHYYSLGNKVGEYLMAGLPIAVSDFPEMRRIVKSEGVGVVFDPADPQSIAKAIRDLVEPKAYKRKRENVLRARKKYSWEREERKLLGAYERLEKDHR